MASRSSSRSRHRYGSSGRSKRSRKPLLIGIAGVLVVLLGLAGWLGWEASKAQTALSAATQEAQGLQADLTSGDSELAAKRLAALQGHTTTARENTDGPLWSVAGSLPFVGASIDAVRTASASLDDIAQNGLDPIVESSTALDSDLFRPEDGRFPVQRFAEIAPAITEASTVLTRNREAIDDIDDDALLGPVRKPVADLKDKVGTAQTAASAAARALSVAPELLGAEGRRSYLVLFQNNAESRSTGGIPGAVALVRANKGRLVFDEQFSVRDLGFPDDPVVELTDDERQTYDPTMASDIRNVNFTPDFPRTAEIARALVREQTGVEVDGVMSIDPVALSYALEGTGPVKVGDNTTLTTENAVDTLLNTVYARYPDPLQQDAFFADAAERIFSSVLGGRGDSRKTLEGLAKADRERRIMLWSTNDGVQEHLAGTRLSGALPGNSTTPHVGVYLDDATESKMQYYLDWKTTVDASRCTDAGAQTLESTTTLTSSAPADASQLPRYITGSGKRADAGNQQLAVRIFAPWGGELESLEIDGEPVTFGVGKSGERQVLVTNVRLAPGDERVLKVTMTTGDEQRRGAVVTTTPGVRSLDQDKRFPSACS